MFILWYLLIGLAAGFIANWIVGGSRQRLWVNLLLGIVVGVWGGWILSLLGLIPEGSWGGFVCTVIGAALLLWMARQIRGRSRSHMDSEGE